MDGHSVQEVRIADGETVVACECGWVSQPVPDADEAQAHAEHAEHADS